jgi:hypothetical protein
MNKQLNYILSGFFLILLIFSVIFFKERIFYYDSAFQFFKIIFFNSFNIEADRYSTFITQIPALLALKLGFPLKSISIIYSASFIVLYFSIFLIVSFWLKNGFAGLAIAMSFAMGTSLGFFHAVTEIHQAMAYSILFLACLYFSPTNESSILNKYLKFIVGLFILTLAFFCHPAALFLLLFILGFYLIDKNAWRKIDIYLYLLFLVFGTIIKLIVTESNSYEGHLFSQPALFNALVKKFWSLYSFKFFFKQISGIYFFTVLTGLIVTINYIYLKNWAKLAYFLVASGAFFLITLVTYHEGNADIAMERIFLPLNVFVSIPFCKDFVFRQRKLSMPIKIYLVLLLTVGVGFILNGADKYVKRTNYLKHMIRETHRQNVDKLIVSRDQLNMDLVEVPWALSTETLLLSSLNGDSSTTIYFAESKEDISKINVNDPNALLIANFWLYWKADKLNMKYFRLKLQPYNTLDGDFR